MTTSVKLAKLTLSPINVRKRPDDLLEIPQMAADLEARGVLQNLLVTPVKKPRGTFEVFDGGRRLRGLLMLAERGVIDPDTYDVPVKVLVGDEATLSETSTAANFHQLKMTPAEECRAFQYFIGLNGDIDGVAKRFGLTRRFVEGRLRLATLAEPIFEALSEGTITLDVAKAYASTENQEKQLLVWNTYGTGYANADTIRRVIANETMKSNDPVAILVGEDRYVEAGGKIDRDLFSDSGDKWVNPEIAQRLAADIMEAEAKRIGEERGLAWIRPIASNYTHSAAAGLYRVILPAPDLTEEQLARLDAITQRQEAIAEEMDDEIITEEAYKALDQEYDTLSEEEHAIHNVAPVLPDEIKPLVGAFLKLTPKGEMVLDTEYYSEEPVQVGGSDDEAGGDEDSGTSGRAGGTGREHASPPPRPEAVAPGGKPLSARLYDELAMQRRDVLAATLLSHPALALDYALFVMIDDRMSTFSAYGSTIRARSPQDPVSGEQPSTRARGYLAEAHDGLDASWTEHKSEVERFEAFRALDDDGKAAWLAYIVAMSLEAKPSYRAEQCPLHNRLATIMEVDVASWWRPTSENFFDRVSKGSILTLLADVGGAALTARHATMKKSEISESCAKLFAGEAIVEPEVRDAALAWVPNAMKFLDQAEADDLEVAEDDAEAQMDDAEIVEAGEGEVAETVSPNETDTAQPLADQDALAA
ncbi:ParB/RepB/Spo0J family partition protein [Novosphingobium album (ex Liu et al. 2023)]|uniref:ParB/RepB/Spo0J family partition protein n=1 Tax=Novosphingobium album (ex Liu et al. 2023) TaxID=3031130 RepID=A0ABT5WXK7_9SPHN|nr:ParB/RepB/Spo0J family partition protein [Novosphingobium album (ex Liu et al. 2023)]MDE8654639.1 ParB/RepB/Spo0J family partition protein [Novosphingobium album (ex Liu et al. 2023)]